MLVRTPNLSSPSFPAWRRCLVGVGAALMLLIPAPAAVALPISLSSDLRGTLGAFCVVCEFQTEIDGFFVGSDRVTFGLSPGTSLPLHLGGFAFFDAPIANNRPVGDLTITTVYGIDQDPANALLRLTGFDRTAPQLVPLSGETFFSAAGNSYHSFRQAPALLQEIGALLPGHDLSPFMGGTPDSVLYVYQTIVPVSDFLAVPEPATLGLLIAGALGMGVGRIRAFRRQ